MYLNKNCIKILKKELTEASKNATLNLFMDCYCMAGKTLVNKYDLFCRI